MLIICVCSIFIAIINIITMIENYRLDGENDELTKKLQEIHKKSRESQIWIRKCYEECRQKDQAIVDEQNKIIGDLKKYVNELEIKLGV